MKRLMIAILLTSCGTPTQTCPSLQRGTYLVTAVVQDGSTCDIPGSTAYGQVELADKGVNPRGSCVIKEMTPIPGTCSYRISEDCPIAGTVTGTSAVVSDHELRLQLKLQGDGCIDIVDYTYERVD